MQCHSPTRVLRQVTPITTFCSNKCSTYGKFARFLIAIPSYCRAVLGSRGSFNDRKFKPVVLPFDPYHLITLTSSANPCAWSVFFDDMWNSTVGVNIVSFPFWKELIAKMLKRNAIRGFISPFVDSRDSCVARDFSLPEKQRVENDGA